METECPVDLDEGDMEDVPLSDNKMANLSLLPFITCAQCKVMRESQHLFRSCFHPICTPCVLNIHSQAGSTVPLSAEEMSRQELYTIPPHACNICQVTNEQVIFNPFANLPAEGQSSRTCQWCQQMNKPTGAAVGMCEECNVWLCTRHLDVHNDSPDKADHTINAIQLIKNVRACQIHNGASLDFYCRPCAILTCSKCQLLHHRDHDFSGVMEMKAEIVSLMATQGVSYKEMAVTRNRMAKKRIANAKKELEDNTETARDALVTKVQEIVSMIRSWHDDLTSCLEQNLARRTALLDTHLEKLDQEEEGIGYMEALLDTMITRCRPSDVALLGIVVLSVLKPKEEVSKDLNSEASLEAHYHVTFQSHENVEPLVRQFGHICLDQLNKSMPVCKTSPVIHDMSTSAGASNQPSTSCSGEERKTTLSSPPVITSSRGAVSLTTRHTSLSEAPKLSAEVDAQPTGPSSPLQPPPLLLADAEKVKRRGSQSRLSNSMAEMKLKK